MSSHTPAPIFRFLSLCSVIARIVLADRSQYPNSTANIHDRRSPRVHDGLWKAFTEPGLSLRERGRRFAEALFELLTLFLPLKLLRGLGALAKWLGRLLKIDRLIMWISAQLRKLAGWISAQIKRLIMWISAQLRKLISWVLEQLDKARRVVSRAGAYARLLWRVKNPVLVHKLLKYGSPEEILALLDKVRDANRLLRLLEKAGSADQLKRLLELAPDPAQLERLLTLTHNNAAQLERFLRIADNATQLEAFLARYGDEGIRILDESGEDVIALYRLQQTHPYTGIDLVEQEVRGGHSIERHGPRLSMQEMEQRVLGTHPTLPQSRTALRFNSAETMDSAVNEALQYYQSQIDAHFMAGGGRLELPPYDTGRSIGEGYTNIGTRQNPVSQHVPPDQVTKVQIVLEPDPTAPGGYRVHTAFPVWP